MPEPLPPVARRLAWLHFWNDFTLDFITPLLPTGVGVAWLGVMEGVADAVGQALKLVTGRASDRTGKRVRWVVAGYSANALFRPLAAIGMLVVWPWWIVCCRIADRVGKGLRSSASDALVADWVAPEQRPWAYSMMRTYDHCGATVGALTAAGVAWYVGEHLHLNLGWAVLSLVVPMVAMLALGAGLRDQPDAARAAAQAPPGWWPREPLVRRPLLIITIASIGARVSPLLVLVQVAGWTDASMTDGGAWRPWQICLAWAALNLAQTIASAWAAWFADRLGPHRLLLVGWGVGAVVFTALAWSTGAWALVAGLAWGIVGGLTEGAEKAWLVSVAAPNERATTFGALALLTAGAALIGSSGCGLGLSAVGPLIFLAPAVAMTVGAIGVARTPRRAAGL
ncbi:MAG: MFS transporter [Planctomycetes bacterium]|nr:MFS transporter [Planctomycetota bacterium]